MDIRFADDTLRGLDALFGYLKSDPMMEEFCKSKFLLKIVTCTSDNLNIRDWTVNLHTLYRIEKLGHFMDTILSGNCFSELFYFEFLHSRSVCFSFFKNV